jgi:uncharacterized protein (DUF2235 family)
MRPIFNVSLTGVLIMAIAAATSTSLAAQNVAPHPSKRLVLCLDGTWNNPYDEHKRRDGHTVLKPTNPLKTCRAVMPFDAKAGRVQVAYYDIGVGSLAEYPGTSNALLHWSDRVLGGAYGAGFEGNVENALHFLVLNFEKGDDVFVFGFSRGAATARAVTNFLDWNGGLPEKEDAYYLPRLFRAYVISHGAAGVAQKELDAINTDRATLEHPAKPALKPFRPVRVAYLGVWDTVMALGSRFRAAHETTSAASRSFYAGTTPAACVEYARQALAIDEARFDFRPEVWKGKRGGQRMEQRWFAGVHSNVGGGYGNDGLANITFHWILDGAREQGLNIDEEYVSFFRPFARHSLYQSSSALYTTLEFLRGRVGRGKRSLVDAMAQGNADIDKSVIDRMQAAPGDLSTGKDDQPVTKPYRPENVMVFLAAQPDVDAYLKKIGAKGALPDDVKKHIEELRRSGRPPAAQHVVVQQ